MSIDNPLKTDFAGKDGFNWFFAKVVPEKNWKTVSDSLNLDGKQSHRVKIRVCGHDPFDESVLPDSECRWAQLTSDPKFGNGVEGLGETNCMVGGESVLGFFCDGPDGQVPVILASLPAASTEVENRRNNLENGNPLVKRDGENNGTTVGEDGVLRITVTANKEEEGSGDATYSNSNAFGLNYDDFNIGPHQYDSDFYTKQFPTSIYVRKGGTNNAAKAFIEAATNNISSIDKCSNDVIGRLRAELQDFIKFTQTLNFNLGTWTDPLTNEIVNMDYQLDKIKEGFVGLLTGAVNNIRKRLLKKLNKKFSKLLGKIKTSKEGKDQNISTGSQKASKNILKLIACVFGKVLGGIGGILKNMFNNLLGKVVNGALCAIDQFISGIFAKIFDNLESGLSTIMSGLSWLVGGLSSVTGLLRSASALAGKILDFLNGCGTTNCTPSKTWTSAIAGGVIPRAPDDWDKQISNVNIFNGISKGLKKAAEDLKESGEDVSDVSVNGVPLEETIKTTEAINEADAVLGTLGLGSVESALSQTSLFGAQNLQFDACNNKVKNPTTQDDITPTRPGFIYPKCLPPVVKVSGTGSGAEFLPIVGNDRRIFSIEVLNGGSGYDETTGLTVVDNTGNGKGAFARPIVKDGVIEKVVLMQTGFDYCLNTTDKESVGIGTNVVGTLTDVFIDKPGYKYDSDDKVLIGNVFLPIITAPTGEVLGVKVPPNLKDEYTVFPEIKFFSNTGFGARAIPIMSFSPQFSIDTGAEERRAKPLIGIKDVVDCIGDKNELVGYVNGVPYYGPFHFHPSRGVKMVGSQHVDYPHEIIYDTMEESLGQPPVVSQSSSVTSTETTETSETTTPVDTTPNIVTEQTTPTTPVTDTTTSTDTSSSSSSSSDSTPPSTPPSNPPSGSGGYGGGY